MDIKEQNINFENFGLAEELLRSLDEQGLSVPTEIQSQVIPSAIKGGDVVAQAPTGTGKTLAFLLPILQRLDREDDCVQAVILCPTRELVIQICEVLQRLVKYYERVRIAGLYGGQNIQKQLFCLRKKPQIVVGTPGRMLDHLDRRTLRLSDVKVFVLDECDEMLDMGFRGDIEKINGKIGDCQRLCFSATIPKNIRDFIEHITSSPEYIKTTLGGEEIPKIRQFYSVVKDAQRVGAALKIIDSENYGVVMIFCNTKTRADKVCYALTSKGRSAAVIHSDLPQSARTQIIKRFKAKEISILVATDVAARGLDVDGVQAIINFDPPTDCDFYVHRIGRTARADKDGAAYTLIDSSQVGYVPSYQKVSDNALQYKDLGAVSDSFTLPKDASNKLRDFHDNQSRFFINAGKRDLLDKDSFIKLILSVTQLKIYEIADVKIRDTYSFVSVVKGGESKIFKLKGVKLGNRELNVQQAKEEEKTNSSDSRSAAAKKSFGPKNKSRIAKKSDDRAAKKKGAGSVRSDAPGRKRADGGKKQKPPQSRKGKLSALFEDELNYSYKQTAKRGGKKN